MVKHLVRHGNSWGILLDKGIRELLGIRPGTPISMTTDGRNILLSPVHDDLSEKAFKKILGKVVKRYGPALKRLADA